MKKISEEEYMKFCAEEIKRCEEEPWYFYNKYWKKPDARELTKEDWEAMQKQRYHHTKLRRIHAEHPIVPDDAYELPNYTGINEKGHGPVIK